VDEVDVEAGLGTAGGAGGGTGDGGAAGGTEAGAGGAGTGAGSLGIGSTPPGAGPGGPEATVGPGTKGLGDESVGACGIPPMFRTGRPLRGWTGRMMSLGVWDVPKAAMSSSSILCHYYYTS